MGISLFRADFVALSYKEIEFGARKISRWFSSGVTDHVHTRASITYLSLNVSSRVKLVTRGGCFRGMIPTCLVSAFRWFAKIIQTLASSRTWDTYTLFYYGCHLGLRQVPNNALIFNLGMLTWCVIWKVSYRHHAVQETDFVSRWNSAHRIALCS